jgi:hypothetical protein
MTFPLAAEKYPRVSDASLERGSSAADTSRTDSRNMTNNR